ncbi:MAG: hypothetical protein R3B06_06290 [Kofleriaceae bacterium]
MQLHNTIVALSLALAACGGSKKSAGPGQDWSGKPLDTTITDKVKGVGFTIKAPAGMKLDGTDADPDAITKRWQADVDDYFSEPSFSVAYAAIPAKDVDGFVRDAMLGPKDVVAKQAATDDGFVLTTHTQDNGTVRASVLKRKGDVTLTCRASQAKTGGVPSPEKTLAWLESLCSSLTIQ